MSNGRTVIFAIPKKEKEKLRLEKFSKKIVKKEKRIKLLAQHVKQTIVQQEKFIYKKRELEDLIVQASNQIEEETKENSVTEVSQQIETL